MRLFRRADSVFVDGTVRAARLSDKMLWTRWHEEMPGDAEDSHWQWDRFIDLSFAFPNQIHVFALESESHLHGLMWLDPMTERSEQWGDHLETSITLGDEACSSIAGGSLDRLVRNLPDPHVKGSLLYSWGQVHFKGPAVDRCPRCGKPPKWLPTTLTFRHAPAAARVQPTEGWVCECGEKYVPGELAREAYQRAFESHPA